MKPSTLPAWQREEGKQHTALLKPTYARFTLLLEGVTAMSTVLLLTCQNCRNGAARLVCRSQLPRLSVRTAPYSTMPARPSPTQHELLPDLSAPCHLRPAQKGGFNQQAPKASLSAITRCPP